MSPYSLDGLYHVPVHPLLDSALLGRIERAASAHRGRPWRVRGFTDLADRASHPCGILHGEPFSVFGKLDAPGRSTVELRALELLRGKVSTPVPIGVVPADGGDVLLCEALDERPVRSTVDWRAIGYGLAALHAVRADRFGLDFDVFFGPLPQDNRPVPGGSWADFFRWRRLFPLLRNATDSGHLPDALRLGVERLLPRVPELCGPEPDPALLHGDAQQNNVVSTPSGAVFVDPAPYFGHPEVDLAMLDLFAPVPDAVLDAYRERAPLDHGFPERRELWRLPGYLAVVAVEGDTPFGRGYLPRIAETVRRYA